MADRKYWGSFKIEPTTDGVMKLGNEDAFNNGVAGCKLGCPGDGPNVSIVGIPNPGPLECS